MEGTNITLATAKQSFEMLDRFHNELDRFERILSMTEDLLSPVCLMHDSPPGDVPKEVQYHPYHGAIMRLEALNNRAEDLRSRIRF